jgi:tetratricopeptide (TPR) repeat protein
MNTPIKTRPVAPLDRERLKNLPIRPDVWQLGFVRMPAWVAEEGAKPFRPQIGLCHSTASGLVGTGGILAPGDPTGPAALAAVVHLATMKGVSYRPEQIEVRDPKLAETLRLELADVGIDAVLTERLDGLDEVIADMARHFGSGAIATRFFEPGVEVERLRAFAEAAAAFYRAAPWNHLIDEDLVRVEAPETPAGLGWLSVLGAGGRERGLAFYSSRKDFERFLMDETPEFYAAETRRWLFGYDEVMDWPIADSELWEEQGLPVADARAYPSLICHLGNGRTKPAGAEQLAFVEALLRALTATTEDELDSGRWSKTAPTIEGERTVELSLPALLGKTPRSGRRGHESGATLPDRRLLERALTDIQRLLAEQEFQSAEEANAFLAAQGGRVQPRAAPRTPEERAQELVYQALEEQGRLRVKLAREALRLWPDCTEAWVLRAEEMPDRERRTELYRQAVEAGERTLGPKPFAEDVGHFWGILETRPYMRARNGLAGALWAAGRHDEAIAHWQDLLRLNPEDNQGVRDMLVPRLIVQRRDEEADAVLAAYADDASAMLSYARALLEFRRSGDGGAAQAKLAAALRDNPHVAKYLTGGAAMHEDLPEFYRPGSEDEAQLAAAMLAAAWHASEGAVEWLRRSRRLRKKQREGKRRRAKVRK